MKIYVLIAAFKDDGSGYATARTIGIYRNREEAREKLKAPIFRGEMVRMIIDEVDFEAMNSNEAYKSLEQSQQHEESKFCGGIL